MNQLPSDETHASKNTDPPIYHLIKALESALSFGQEEKDEIGITVEGNMYASLGRIPYNDVVGLVATLRLAAQPHDLEWAKKVMPAKEWFGTDIFFGQYDREKDASIRFNGDGSLWDTNRASIEQILAASVIRAEMQTDPALCEEYNGA